MRGSSMTGWLGARAGQVSKKPTPLLSYDTPAGDRGRHHVDQRRARASAPHRAARRRLPRDARRDRFAPELGWSVRKVGAEPVAPAANDLMTDYWATFRQRFDVAQTESDPAVPPDRAPDARSGIVMAIAERLQLCHALALSVQRKSDIAQIMQSFLTRVLGLADVWDKT
jgi:hypothetical protein